jgi:hypothetical protein
MKNPKKRKAENPTQIGTVWTPLKSAWPAEDRPDATVEQLRDRIAELKESGQRDRQRIRELNFRGRIKTDAMLVLLQEMKTEVQEEF